MSIKTEVEVKALVQEPVLLCNIIECEPYAYIKIESTQRNHYFKADTTNLTKLTNAFPTSFLALQKLDLSKIKKLSVRTREDSQKGVIFVCKYGIANDDSINGIIRKELEIVVDEDLETLDDMLLGCGIHYESKWSRSRVEYKMKDFNICVDTNAGFRGICEIEKVLKDGENEQSALVEVRKELDYLGLVELEQNMLNKMFDFYTEHWEEYYGTDKSIFDNVRFIS